MNIKNSVIASKNWTLNATAAAWKKFDGGVTGQSTTSTPWKFDEVSRRNSTTPGSTPNRYIAITTLAIIAAFLVYLRQFLIDLHQIYRHSSVSKTH